MTLLRNGFPSAALVEYFACTCATAILTAGPPCFIGSQSGARDAGMKHARLSGKKVGRPRHVFDRQKEPELRQQGWGYARIAEALGVDQGAVVRAPADAG
jgi:hypothetical protein